jgi:hypothetical protein
MIRLALLVLVAVVGVQAQFLSLPAGLQSEFIWVNFYSFDIFSIEGDF